MAMGLMVFVVLVAVVLRFRKKLFGPAKTTPTVGSAVGGLSPGGALTPGTTPEHSNISVDKGQANGGEGFQWPVPRPSRAEWWEQPKSPQLQTGSWLMDFGQRSVVTDADKVAVVSDSQGLEVSPLVGVAEVSPAPATVTTPVGRGVVRTLMEPVGFVEVDRVWWEAESAAEESYVPGDLVVIERTEEGHLLAFPIKVRR
jgi:hypothetical protein